MSTPQLSSTETDEARRAKWAPLEGGHLPPPTYWPAGLALAVTLLFWGLISSWVITLLGLWLFATSLAGWIADIRHERKSHS